MLNRRHIKHLHRRNARPCFNCGRPTIGTPGLNDPTRYWPLCGPCKVSEDAAADARLVLSVLPALRREAVARRERIEA